MVITTQLYMTISESYITSNMAEILVWDTVLGRPLFIMLKVATLTWLHQMLVPSVQNIPEC